MDDILSNTLAMLTVTPETWAGMVRLAPDKLLRRPAAEGQWSPLECLNHLVEIENLFLFRLTVFMNEGESFPAYDPDSPENKMASKAKPGDLAAEFKKRRGAGLQALQSVTKSMLTRRARHAELGEVTLEQMLHEWVAHDLNHTVQAQRALMQPFIEGSGPWIKYFADHIALKP